MRSRLYWLASGAVIWSRLTALVGLTVAAWIVVMRSDPTQVAEVFVHAPFSWNATAYTFDLLLAVAVAASLCRHWIRDLAAPSQPRDEALQAMRGSPWRTAKTAFRDLLSGPLEELLRVSWAYAAVLAVGGRPGHPPPAWALLAATAAWAYLGHADYRPMYLAAVFCMGLVLSGSYLITGTVLVPIIAHSTFNLANTVIYLTRTPGRSSGAASTEGAS